MTADIVALRAALSEAVQAEDDARRIVREGEFKEAFERFAIALTVRKKWQGNENRDFLDLVDEVVGMFNLIHQPQLATTLMAWALSPTGWEPFPLNELFAKAPESHLETLQEVIALEIEAEAARLEALRLH